MWETSMSNFSHPVKYLWNRKLKSLGAHDQSETFVPFACFLYTFRFLYVKVLSAIKRKRPSSKSKQQITRYLQSSGRSSADIIERIKRGPDRYVALNQLWLCVYFTGWLKWLMDISWSCERCCYISGIVWIPHSGSMRRTYLRHSNATTIVHVETLVWYLWLYYTIVQPLLGYKIFRNLILYLEKQDPYDNAWDKL